MRFNACSMFITRPRSTICLYQSSILCCVLITFCLYHLLSHSSRFVFFLCILPSYLVNGLHLLPSSFMFIFHQTLSSIFIWLPFSVIQHPYFVVHLLSSIFCHQSSVVHLTSLIFYHLPSVFHCLPSIVQKYFGFVEFKLKITTGTPCPSWVLFQIILDWSTKLTKPK